VLSNFVCDEFIAGCSKLYGLQIEQSYNMQNYFLVLVVMGIAFHKNYNDPDRGCTEQDLTCFSLRYHLVAIESIFNFILGSLDV